MLVSALVSCDGGKDSKDHSGNGDDSAGGDSYLPPNDGDGDGVTAADGDCADDNSEIYPGRGEDCDGIDNNCNGGIDEGLPDTDGDGTADCTDVEECDGLDNDGDGYVDEKFEDADGDGVADCVGTEACDGVDNDGDGEIDEGYDADGDGATQCGSSTEDADCDDTDASRSPSASETAGDLVDNDCDGLVDEGSWAAGDLALTEIMNNPAMVSDPDGEWFEVYNASGRTLILNGLYLMSTVDGEEVQVLDDDLIYLEPGDFFVFGSNDDPTTNGDVEVGYRYEGLLLSNESDEITLVADGIVLDSLEWDDGATMPDPDGASMGTDYGVYDSTLNNDTSIWCAATIGWSDNPAGDKGSPGTDNEYCSTYDHDGDGFTPAEGDCDDDDATTYPDAWEGTDPIDNDCDGDAETAPVAVASATTSGYQCDDVQLSSSGSYDIEGAALTYSWELTSAPSSSAKTTADINTPTSANPDFNPDEPGTYVFTLVVNDGGADSAPTSVSVTVGTRPTNTDPVAYAGADQSSSASVTCNSISYGTAWSCDDCDSADFTLDASGSTDADSDDLTYAWSITSGSYGTLSGSTGSSVTLTVSGVPATYGTTLDDTTVINVVVTDCMGASSSDDVSVTYSCTGA
jgi:hypothetical protein